MSQDENAAAHERLLCLHRLTNATNALVARRYMDEEENAILAQLEAYVALVEADAAAAEGQLREVTDACAVLQPGINGWTATETRTDPDLAAAHAAHGKDLHRLYESHLRRFEALQEE